MNLNDYTVIILAAGLGKRLAPLTQVLPKPACPLYGEPICVSMIRQVFDAGAQTIHINTSYLSTNLEAEVKAYLAETKHEILPSLRFWHEPQRLETGGAIVRIWLELGKPRVKGLLVISGDIVGKIPIKELVAEYEQRDKDTHALMAVKRLVLPRHDVTWVDTKHKLVVGFGRSQQLKRNEPEGQFEATEGTLFSNYQIIAPEALESIPLTHASSIPHIYEPLLHAQKKIAAMFIDEELPWFNVGTPQEYSQCLDSLIKHDWRSLTNSRSLLRTSDQALQPKAYSLQGSLLSVTPGASRADQTVLIQTLQISQLTIQRLIRLPATIALSETQQIDFHLGLKRFLAIVQDLIPKHLEKKPWEARPIKPDAGGERLTLWMRIPKTLAETFTIHIPQPILVGANHFLEIALSQRGSREAALDWVDILFTD